MSFTNPISPVIFTAFVYPEILGSCINGIKLRLRFLVINYLKILKCYK